MDNFHKMKVFLIEKNITQRELAEKVGIHYARINGYLNGGIRLKDRDIKRLCSGLKINFEHFLKNKIVELKK